MQVDFTAMTQVSLVLSRQAEHAAAIEQYARTHTDLRGDFGLLLCALTPVAVVLTETGAGAAALVRRVADAGARGVTGSMNAYVEADRLSHEDFARILQRLGVSLPPFVSPVADVPPVCLAAETAPAGYGDEPDWIWEKGANLGQSVADSFTHLRQSVTSIPEHFVAGAVVAEKIDASTYLVVPVPGENFVEDMRWSAGLVLGGLDWVAEQCLGYSILEEIVFKPFAGDWREVEKAALAWGHQGDAYLAMSENFAAMASTGASWTGDAGQAFRLRMVGAAAALAGLSTACGAVSGAVGNVATATKLACSGLAYLLGLISRKLLEMAGKLALPVVGWAAAAATFAQDVIDVINAVRLGYAIGDAIFEAIAGVVDGKLAIFEALGLVEELATWAYRSATGEVR